MVVFQHKHFKQDNKHFFITQCIGPTYVTCTLKILSACAIPPFQPPLKNSSSYATYPVSPRKGRNSSTSSRHSRLDMLRWFGTTRRRLFQNSFSKNALGLRLIIRPPDTRPYDSLCEHLVKRTALLKEDPLVACR